LAEKAQQTIDAFVTASAVLEDHQNSLNDARRASADEKAAIKNYLEAHATAMSLDLPASEILAGAGVRKVQGTSSFATRELKRVLQLTHSNARKAA
jgi:hypothetical protein